MGDRRVAHGTYTQHLSQGENETMNKREAYRMGVESGFEATIYGDFTSAELASEDAFKTACYECCENKAQYAGHPSYDFTQEHNADNLFDAFSAGENTGINRGWNERKTR